MSKQPDINFRLLTEHELFVLESSIKNERERRKKKPEELIEVIYCNDGAEGFYCPVDLWFKIPAVDLQEQMLNDIKRGELSFELIKIDKKEYQRECAMYEWRLGVGINTPVIEDED